MTYRVIAQSYTTNQRLSKTVEAPTEGAAHVMVARELEDAGYYVADIREATR